MSADDVLVVAGEASGDLYGGRLLEELGQIIPRLRPFGLGGDEMAKCRFAERGFEAVAHSREIAVVGLTEALRILPRAWQVFRRLLEEVDRRDAKIAILIDSPDFNLRLAKQLKRRGVRVIYYISPQVWAWRKGRVKLIAKTVDRMLVVFPFEVDFYRRHDVEVVHVGHPLIDEMPELPQAWDGPPPAGEPFRIALLPGSRRSEVNALLRTMLESIRRMSEDLPVVAYLIEAPTVDRELFDEMIATSDVEMDGAGAGALRLERVTRDRFAVIAASHLALCASGTATIEVGLLGTPMVVLYRLHRWTYLLARFLVDLDHFSMVNLVLGRRAVPELAQHEAEPCPIAAEARRLLENPVEIAAMRSALAELRPRLGSKGASRRAAAEVAALLAPDRSGVT